MELICNHGRCVGNGRCHLAIFSVNELDTTVFPPSPSVPPPFSWCAGKLIYETAWRSGVHADENTVTQKPSNQTQKSIEEKDFFVIIYSSKLVHLCSSRVMRSIITLKRRVDITKKGNEE